MQPTGPEVPPAAPALPPGGMVARRKTGVIGAIFKWIFVVFNVVMAVFLFVYWNDVANIEAPSGAASAGKVIGGAIGTGLLLLIWLVLGGLLAILMLATRGPLQIVPASAAPTKNIVNRRIAWAAIAAFILVLLLLRPSKEQATPQASGSPNAPAASTVPAKPKPAFGGQSYTVDLSGTPNVRFAGTCMVVGSGGNTQTGDVAGTIPQRFQFRGSMISCSAQNQGDYGRMKMVIMRGNQIVAESQTSQPYGALAAAGQ